MEAKFEPETLKERHYLAKLKYLVIAITNQNLIHEEITQFEIFCLLVCCLET
jgi:hypothetical protein